MIGGMHRNKKKNNREKRKQPNPACSGLGFRQGGTRRDLLSLVRAKAASGAKPPSPLNKPLGSLTVVGENGNEQAA